MIMRRQKSEQALWAREQFGKVVVGDERRTLRLVGMAERAAERPSGKISEVFSEDRERQGAYDLLESGRVDVSALTDAMGSAAARLARGLPFSYVAIDGASVTLTDRGRVKDFGAVGKAGDGGRGLKVVNALGMDGRGVPVGVFGQVWWTRQRVAVRVGSKKARRRLKQRWNRLRPSSEKETRYWMEAIDAASSRAREANARLWFLLDREADNHALLTKLAESNHQFTVRGAWDRVIEDSEGGTHRLLQWLDEKSPRYAYEVNVPAAPNRRARLARVSVRWGKVVLRMHGKNRKDLLEVSAVWAREHGTCLADEKPLDWLLLTSADVRTSNDAREVIFGYTLRWRIESFHKTWKSGACNVEKTQLRSSRAVMVWATMLAAVAARIERLKLLSRSEPEKPASIELDAYEIRALILLKRDIKKRTETIPDTMPTIAQATLWISQLGGYTGKSSGGPPGSITIRRGLDYLRPAAHLLRRLEGHEE